MNKLSAAHGTIFFACCVTLAFAGSHAGAFAQERTDSAHLRLPPGPFERWSPIVLEIDGLSNSSESIDDSADIGVQITDPSGSTALFPAFRTATSAERTLWQCRFTPREIGRYSARVPTATDGDQSSNEVRFDVTASNNSRGFLRGERDRPFFLTFDNREQFRGIGTNIAWEPRRRRRGNYTYDAMFPKIAANGLNTVRTWICPWNMPIEWNTPQLGEYDENAAQRLDEMFALAKENQLYVVLVLGYHGELQTESGAFPGNDRWKENPYNVANGGPCKNPAEFFTNPQAKSLYKKKLRYLVARVAYQPHLLAWEFWNEIDHIERRGPVPGHVLVAWHEEMADYLRTIDPYHHPITTSTSTQAPEGLWEIEDIDLISLHTYGKTDGMADLLTRTNAKFGKPVVAGEFSCSWQSADREEAEQFERELRLGMWRGLTSPTPILPMTWWWEFHDSRDDWKHFRPLAEFSDRMTRLNASEWNAFQPASTAESLECRGVQIEDRWFLWLHNRGEEALDPEVTIEILNVPRGDYRWRQFSTLTGEPMAQGRTPVNSDNGRLSIIAPPLEGLEDTSLIIDTTVIGE